jgi:hypothetical protein
MGNQKFEDISVLKALVRLRAGGLLHPDDSKVLIDRLQTDWGRQRQPLCCSTTMRRLRKQGASSGDFRSQLEVISARGCHVVGFL